MTDIISIFLNFDKQAPALYLQVGATILIGLLAWLAARGQNIIAEKTARKELFKLRYENLYQKTNTMFLTTIELTEKYTIARHSKPKNKRVEKFIEIQEKYETIKKDFLTKIEQNKFLIKPRDYDKLYSFCENYLSEVGDYVYGRKENEICSNHDVVACFNQHYKTIPQILYSYLYYENESQFSFYLYKIQKYLKKHIREFLLDYFPSFCQIIGDILFLILLLGGILFTIFEAIKELLKADIEKTNGKFSMKFKCKSAALKRNRPWPL
ncbi:MAG: hypothetical protein E7Z87_08470 [Cyanobacteria bacterium SIG26]|nr:hypothetical protein [Cyanobacteria bacterium SIG26]